MQVPFYKPDIRQEELDAVAEVLSSGWITTGAVTRDFENELAGYTGADHAVCFSSATAGLEMVLRQFGVTSGDRVITTPYTYAATVNAILHCGAEPVLVDLLPGTWEMDPEAVAKRMDGTVKAVIPVDFAGWPCDHDRLAAALDCCNFRPENSFQEGLGRPLLLCDAAHSLGSRYKGQRLPDSVDVAVYSFHAVKNITTAEGGAAVFREKKGVLTEETVRSLRIRSLHGQTKDAFSKFNGNGWEYDILEPGFKCNMTDLQAAIGRSQLKRYEETLRRRAGIADDYSRAFSESDLFQIPEFDVPERECAWHIYPLRLAGADEALRNTFISKINGLGVTCNVHFKPLPLFTAFSGMFDVGDFPNTMRMYENEVTLPLYPSLSDDTVRFVIESVERVFGDLSPG